MNRSIWKIFPVALVLSLTSWTLSKNKTTIVNSTSTTEEKTEKPVVASLTRDTITISSFKQFDSLFISRTNDSKTFPRLYIESTKNSLDQLSSKQRKATFINMIAIHALKINEEIIQERAKITSRLSDPSSKGYIDSLLKLYRCKNVNELDKKLNIIPVDLIIAQAITESGWGRSYSAKKRNAFFGQTTGKKNGKLTYKSFENAQSAVRGYVLNINRHYAYKTMRKIRNEQITKGGSSLILGMTSYSELGDRYVKYIQSIIKMYDLEKYNDLRLESDKESVVKITT